MVVDMARDIKALELLRKELLKLNALPDPPRDLDKIKVFEKKWSQHIEGTERLFDDIAAYTKAIHAQMELIRDNLNESTEKVQQRILDIIDAINYAAEETYLIDTTPTGASVSQLEAIERLQKLEQKKNRLEESLVETQHLINKIDEMKLLTLNDLDSLKGCIKNWRNVRDESYAEEKSRREAEEKTRKEREEAERLRREEEERRRKEEEEERRREEEERERKREEERRQREEEKRRQEEEERKRLEEEERLRKENEEKMKREEEERRKQEEIRLAKEEKRRREEERKRKEEERRQQEEERRKELERKKKEEEERKRRLDPNNWDTIRYKRNDGEVDGARQGLCCVVSAVPGALQEDDLECSDSDEDKPEETNATAVTSDKPTSSVIHITSRTGRKDLEAPMRVFVPYCPVDGDDEVTVKCSVDGNDWEEKEPIYQPGLLKDLKNVRLVAAEINQFETAKVKVVARTKSEDIIVDKPGLVHQSSIDKKVKFVFPRDTFIRPTRVKLQIRQIQPEHLSRGTQQYDNCENILSTSPLVTVTCDEGTDMDVDVDITRAQSPEKRLEIGRYHHVYRGKDRQWHFADSGMKDRSQDVTLTLPQGKEQYSVLEIETRKEVQRNDVLLAAEEIFNHAHKSVVRLIARQKMEDPCILMLQCLRRDQIDARLAELDTLGYSMGPDTSREFCLADGQKLLVKCKGNIGMTTRTKKNLVYLKYHVYMDSAKQEVALYVVDENKQRDKDTYLGLLVFESADNDRNETKGDMPITMPKIHQPRPRALKTTIRFQPYLSVLCKYLGWRLTQEDDETWLDILRYLESKRDMKAIYRRAKIQFEDYEKRKVCQAVFENWMKSLTLDNDKVQLILDALMRSGYKELASECKLLVEIHQVLFSEGVISTLSDRTTDDLDSLARKLNLSKEAIKQCKSKDSDLQIYQAWSEWQQSDTVIGMGPGATKYCLQIMESTIAKDSFLQDLKLKLEQIGIKE